MVQDMWEAASREWTDFVAPTCARHPEVCPAVQFCFEKYLAARSVVTSRAFSVDEHHGAGLVPLADLFNHRTGNPDHSLHVLIFSPLRETCSNVTLYQCCKQYLIPM
jgi:hypothetical protein